MARNRRFELKLNEREMMKLKGCSKCIDLSQSNIIRAGLFIVMREINQNKKEILSIMDEGHDLASAIITLKTGDSL